MKKRKKLFIILPACLLVLLIGALGGYYAFEGAGGMMSLFMSVDVTDRMESHVFSNEAGDTLPYRLYLPEGLYNGRESPLVLYLHGTGERGYDNRAQTRKNSVMQTLLSEENLAAYPCIVIAPQCPEDQWWDTQPLMSLLEDFTAKHPVDPNRIYITGLSMGGYGTWEMLAAYPDYFAAAVPICGGGDPESAALFAHVPVWAFHGGRDSVVKPEQSREMIAALEAAGGNVEYTEYPREGHQSWERAYREEGLFAWMFAQVKKQVYVYVWNENENSSSKGIRYSYIISDEYTSDMSKIKANATSDFKDVRAIFEQLTPGANVLVTGIYRLKGYGVEAKQVYKISDEIYAAGLVSSDAWVCLDVIPPIIKSFNDYISPYSNEWYSRELAALDEEALYGSKGHMYRFTSLPSFDNQVVVRIEVNIDGTANVHYKVGKHGAYMYGGGGISKSEKVVLGQKETKEFLALLDKAGYWNLPEEIENVGHGGYTVLIEGVKEGVYHIVERWVPETSDPVQSLEEYFFNLIKQKFSE
ncbi:MAG: prolyl oligopeptidase family serine peptidase [Oscillospiraceae bacterium]|nr:prolyl oligopeptidase family serine peptidase [Oscillospiraceae bacterium]